MLETEPAGNVLIPIGHTGNLTITCSGTEILWQVAGHQEDWTPSDNIFVTKNETHSVFTLTEQSIAKFNRDNLTVVCYKMDSTGTGIADQGEHVYILRYGNAPTLF